MSLPGWDSPKFVTSAHTLLEVLGYVSLFFLLLFEVGASIYGHRKDELAQVAEKSRTEQQQREASEAQSRLNNALADTRAAQEKLRARAASEDAKAAINRQPRHLDAETIRRIEEAIAIANSIDIEVQFTSSDKESENLADEIIKFLVPKGHHITKASIGVRAPPFSPGVVIEHVVPSGLRISVGPKPQIP